MIAKTKKRIEILVLNLGKKLGINLSYFIEHGFWVTLRFFFVGLFGLLLTIAFARLGSKELLGQYQYVLSTMALISVLSFPGLNMVALREVSRGNNGVVGQAVKESFKWSLLALPLLVGYGFFELAKGEIFLGEALIVAGVLFFFYYPPNVWYVFYEGKSKFKPVTIRLIVSTVVINLAIIAALALKLTLPWLILLFFGLGSAFSWIYYAQISKKADKPERELDLKYGASCTLQKFTFSLSDSLPQIVMTFILGFEALAVYQIAYVSISLISAFVSALSATYIPLLFKYEKLNHKKFIFLNILIGLGMLFGFLVFVEVFFLRFFGQQYYGSYVLAWIFSFSIILLPLRIYLTNFFTSKNRNGIIITSYLAANCIAPMVFFLTKSCGVYLSIGIYFYAMNVLFFLPLFVKYLSFVGKEKTRD